MRLFASHESIRFDEDPLQFAYFDYQSFYQDLKEENIRKQQ